MSTGVIIVLGAMGLVALVMAIVAISASIPTRRMYERDEIIKASTKGYEVRRRQLQIRLSVSFGLLTILTIISTWAIAVLVDDLQHAPYNFVRQQSDMKWWPPLLSLFAATGVVVFFALSTGAFRRLRALQAIRSTVK
jgi:amino acid transporter